MAYLTLQLFGGISVWLNTTERIRPPSKKSAALLAYLASEPGQRRSRGELSTLLWGNHDTAHARNSLRQTLKLLRKCLHRGERQIICSDGDQVYLDPSKVSSDTQLINQLSDSPSSDELQQASAAYRGEYLAGYFLDERPFEEWLHAERRRYHDRAIAVLRQLQNNFISDGSTREALRIGERLLKLDPAQEDIHRTQMKLLVDIGRRSRALQQYRICREILRAELDVLPEEATETLLESIRGSVIAEPIRTNISVIDDTKEFPAISEDLHFPEVPSLAMLPFRILADDTGEQYYGEGLRYELQAALIRISDLLLIAPSCVNSYRDASDGAERAAHELGIDYVLEGSFRRKGEKIEASFQLTKTDLFRIIWAKQFRTTQQAIGDMQNDIVMGVLESLHIDIHAGEEARIFQHTITEPVAREFFYRGTNIGYNMTKESNLAARTAFREVARLQPDSPVGMTYLSFTYWLEVFKQWTNEPERQLAKGVIWAKRALDIRDGNGLAYIVLSYDHLTRDRHREALASGFKAVEFRPNCPTSNGFLGYVLLHSERPGEAVEWIKQAMRRSPMYPPWFVNVLAAAYRDAGNYEASINVANKSLKMNPADIEARAILCTDFIRTGETHQAIRVGHDIAEVDPAFSCRKYVTSKHYRSQKTAALIEKALRMAQLPE